MAILVTGGMGFIGSHTCVELLNAGYDVVIADNLYNSKALVVDRIEKITGKRPAFYQIDVCDKNALNNLFDKENIDAVIHFAGYKAVGESTHKPIEYYANNLNSTLTLCDVIVTPQIVVDSFGVLISPECVCESARNQHLPQITGGRTACYCRHDLRKVRYYG